MESTCFSISFDPQSFSSESHIKQRKRKWDFSLQLCRFMYNHNIVESVQSSPWELPLLCHHPQSHAILSKANYFEIRPRILQIQTMNLCMVGTVSMIHLSQIHNIKPKYWTKESSILYILYIDREIGGCICRLPWVWGFDKALHTGLELKWTRLSLATNQPGPTRFNNDFYFYRFPNVYW